MRSSLRFLPLVLAAALPLAGCDDSASMAGLEKDVSDLRAQVKKLEADRDRASGRLDTAERRIAGLQEDLVRVQSAAQSATAAAEAAAAQGASGEVAGAPVAAGAKGGSPEAVRAAEDLGRILSTDAGRAVFENAVREYEKRREEERGNRMAAGMVDAFAAKANLSPQQKDKLTQIASKAMTEIGDLWRGMRDAPPEERDAKRQDAVAKMDEIRQRTDDEVKGILDASQWDLYQQESARMRGFMGAGGGPGMGGGPGFGGRRGN